MGRIKELRNKVEDGTATAEDEAELKELEDEAAEAPAGDDGNGDGDGGEGAGDDGDDVPPEKVDAMADAVVARIKEKAAPVLKAIKDAESKMADSKALGEKLIVDKRLGQVPIEKLDEHKIALPDREGKKQKDVSLKTVHFLQALLTNDVQKLQVLTEGTGSAGGFLVPEDFANMIVEDVRDQTVMRRVATEIQTTSDTLHLPRLDTRPQAAFRSEGAVKQTSTAQFSELTFTPYSIASIVTLSQELADDASLGVNGSVINYIARLIVQAIAEREDRAFWTGSGSGQPTGVTDYTIGSLSAGATDTAFADSIQKIFHRLPQGYRNSAAWAGHRTVWERIATLKDSNNNYLLRALADGPTQVLKGRPIYEQNDLPQDELYFGDFSYYTIVDRDGVSVRQSDEATVGGQSAFERNLVHVRVERRTDGELTLTDAVRKITDVTT